MSGKSAFLVVGLLMLLFMAGCGGGEEEQEAAAPPPPPPPPPKVVAGGGPKERASTARPQTQRDSDTDRRPDAEGDPQDLYRVVDSQTTYTVGARPLDPPPLGEPRYVAAVPPSDLPPGNYFVFDRPEASGAPREELTLPEKYEVVHTAGYSDSGLPWRIRCTLDDSVMALVPSGTFLFGTDRGTEETGPPVEIEMPAYYIDVTEVTVEQYNRFRERMRDEGKTVAALSGKSQDEQQPVTGVTWGQAQTFARSLGKELPTEAEWEYAARGAGGFDHPWGNGRPFWGHPRPRDEVTSVGQYPIDRSPFGVYDMAGNAAEWCADWYAPDTHEQAAKANETLRNAWAGPRSPASSGLRVIKGDDPDWNVWGRRPGQMRQSDPRLGFRCVLRAKEPPAEATTAARP